MSLTNSDRKKNDDSPSDLDDLKNVSLTLRIKCTSPGVNSPSNPSGDYEIVTEATATVSTLKEEIRKGIGQPARGRYLRLIAGGRLLAPDTAPISKFNINDGDCIHAVLAAAGVRGGMQAAMSRGLAVNDGRSLPRNGSGINHTGLIVPIRSDESDEDDLEAGIERRGFDRLRENGLSRDEVGAIRLYFSQQVDQFIEQSERQGESSNDDQTSPTVESNSNNSQSDTNSERLQMEEDWMNVQGPHSEFRLNLNANNPLLIANRNVYLTDDFAAGNGASTNIGTDKDFAWGFTLGFLVGFVMIFFVWMPTVPHKQKIGILTGLSFKLLLSMHEKLDDNNF